MLSIYPDVYLKYRFYLSKFVEKKFKKMYLIFFLFKIINIIAIIILY